MERQLEQAFTIALKAHAKQVDKVGQPYFMHLTRVMLHVDEGPARVVALLHDLLEDTDWTAEALLKEGFDPEIVEAVDTLTRREDESYDEFTERVMPNPLAVKVKLADLEDNMSRLPGLALVDKKRAKTLEKRYRKAHKKLRKLASD